MKKTVVVFLAVLASAVLMAAVLVGCGGSSSSSAASSASGSASASAAASSASASASTSAAATSVSASSEGLVDIDGVIVKDIGVDMVGDTPNLSVVFSNPTDQNVEVDCSKFEVKKEDGTVVDFTKSKKTIEANQSYTQWAFTAKAGSLSKGDKVDISYDGTSLGAFEVTEF